MLITAFSTGSEYKKYTVSNILGYYVNFGRDIDVKNLLTCNLKNLFTEPSYWNFHNLKKEETFVGN